MPTNWSRIPTYEIDLSQFDEPSEICGYFRKNKIKKYVYRIKYKGLVLKYGMSEGRQPSPGDRLYRQVGHSQSWNNPLKGPNGADWVVIERDIQQEYGISSMHKDDITVKIWDVTKYPFKTINEKSEIERIESELIDEYAEIVGEKPIGNLADSSLPYDRWAPIKDVFSDLFDW